MILFRNEIRDKKEVYINENVEVSLDDVNGCEDIISINDIYASLEAKYVSGIVMCKLNVSGDLVLRSTRSFKPVNYHIDDTNDYMLAFEKSDFKLDDDIIEVDSDQFDFREDIISMIITNIPLKIIGEDDPDHLEGNNWEVISEDEYNKRKKENIDPRLEAFANIDLDEE